MSILKPKPFLFAFALIIVASSLSASQSPDQNFPTPVTTNEIVGTIKARDIGDPRLTTYFYEFGGEQGDVFVNVVTKNFDGDIDIFTLDGLRPLSKIVIYSDAGAVETGRIVYLRKPEKILLRVQGRSPDDLPATFRIKFAGSFVAMRPKRGGDAVKAPVIGPDEAGEVRVNSVGTRIETPQPTTEIAKKPVGERPADPKGTKAPPSTTGRSTAGSSKTSTPAKPKVSPPAPGADPMANFRLVILFRDGGRIEKPMTGVVRFGVERGTLTVVYKDGIIGRYAMANVLSITME